MRLAPFLLLAMAAVACGSAPTPGTASHAPAATAAADIEEISLEISALM